MKIKKLNVLYLLPIVFLMTSSQKTDPDYFEISKNLKLVASVYEKINNYYVDEILPGRVMKKGIDAMLKSLDPYTVYISEAQIEDFRFISEPEIVVVATPTEDHYESIKKSIYFWNKAYKPIK